MTPPVIVGVDTGGTFTDLVARLPGGRTAQVKVPSTPDDPGRAVLDAIAALGAAPDEVRHGTTVATNALLERRGARVVLVATAGFEDVLRLRRQARPDLYALHPEVPPPLVPPEDCVGVRGRLGPGGEEVEPLEPLDAWIARNSETLRRAEAFAVCLLHAYADDRHEAAVAAALRAAFPGVPVSTGHALAPVFRELERTSTVVVNAHVAPVMSRYVARLADALRPGRLSVMASAGGRMGAARAAREPVHTVLSGPAGGVRGAWAAGRRCGRTALLAFDMGGTSTDVAVVQGALRPEDEGAIGEHPLRVPLLPIETVGAGGGSVAFVDAGGALRVGPRSAGAVPGPACYGRGGVEPTVTDAHVVLGRLPALLGGAMPVDAEAARRAVGDLAARLGTPLEDTARAILAIAEATMARACKRVSMERGIDPRGLTLVAFGGAGGLHACALADALGCRDVLFPREPGLLSAEGILDAPSLATATRSVFLGEARWTADALAQLRDEVLAEAAAILRDETGPAPATASVLADCRYAGQTFTLAVPLEGPSLRAAFDAAHAARYGYRLDAPIELVAVRATVSTAEAAIDEAGPGPAGGALAGPRSVSAYSATLWLPPGWRATALASGDLLCERTGGARADEAPSLLPLALEIHRQRLGAIAEEMGANLMGAAFSANIKERRDFSCAVFDADGRMLVHAAHIPVHLGSTPLSVRAAIDAVPMTPGTQVVLNDPFAGGTHLPDVTLVTPVFLDDAARPAFYVANRAHHADVGGVSPGSLPSPRDADGHVRALTVDDEGIRLPPTPLDDALRERFASASRTPAERRGDLRAQEAANHVGALRLRALVDEVGHGRVAGLNDALLDYAERRMRAVIAALPDGEHRFVDRLDDDGAGDAPIEIPVVVRVDGDAAEVDFTGAPDQVAGPLNAVRAIAVSAAFYAFRCLAGEAIPANDGLMRAIAVRTRPGSVVDALPPAAVSAGNVETSQRLVDAIFGALAQAAPDRVPAASCGSMNNVLFGGVDAAGRAFVHYETLGGGAGGSPRGPGASAIHTHMTNTLNTPVEALERAFPVRIERYAVRPETPGTGGEGVVRAYRFLAPAEVNLLGERRRFAPWGRNGAPDGERGRDTLIRADGTRVALPGKVTVPVEPGDVLVVETPGGGGWRPR